MAANSKNLFFQELKDEYNAQFELSNVLAGKSSQLITVSGIFIPLLFGFSSFLIDSTDENANLISFLKALLLIALILAAASIFFSTWAIRTQSYRHSFLPDSFFIKDELNQEEIKEFGGRDADKFYDEMIQEYLESNKHNLKTNDRKARNIMISEYLFLIALVIVPLIVSMSFYYSPK